MQQARLRRGGGTIIEVWISGRPEEDEELLELDEEVIKGFDEEEDERVSLICEEEIEFDDADDEYGVNVTLSSCIVSDLQTRRENPDNLFF